MTRFRSAAGLVLLSFFFLAIASDASAASRFSTLHAFAGPEGALPAAALMRGTDGNFYGTAQSGGDFNVGTIFRMTPAGVVTVLHSFTGGADGMSPFGALVQANDGNFYGTTYSGGAAGLGTVFRMTPAGAVTTIHAFAGGVDGANPHAGLIQASDGNLYGTTQFGGGPNRGTLFGMNLAGSTFFRYTFTGNADGAYPYAPVIQARDGSLYGTVYSGDFSTFGRVFKMTGTTVTNIHTFLSGSDGANPVSALVEGTDGLFYGTTHLGGAFNLGTAYKMTPSGTVTVIKSFSGGPEGANPDTALIQPSDGNFYGAARVGASSGHGTLFKMNPAGVVTVLHTFSGSGDGATPAGALIEAAAGKLYGTAVDGGSSTKGVVYRLATTIVGAAAGDFDGDGKADLTVFRPSNGNWFFDYSGTTAAAVQFGNGLDLPEPGDYDGDGQTDIAVFRPSNGTWFIEYSGAGTQAAIQWGNGNDRPVPADYDGDRITDIAVFRPSNGTWFIQYSGTGTAAGIQWGNTNDVVVPADYDGDHKADIAVFRPSNGTWFIQYSATGTAAGIQWGNASDIAVAADYDGDGKTDIAVFRPSNGTWFIVNSSTGTATGMQWGNGSDVPVPGDYDGDGKTDIAVFRPSNGTWFIVNSTTGTAVAIQWGNGSDIPMLKRS